MKTNAFNNFRNRVEEILPMTIGSLILFAVVLYAFFIVGRTIWVNYNSNKGIEKEALKVEDLEKEIIYLNNQINYYQTYSYKEKEARAKLGYKAPGENVLALPIDEEEDKVEDRSLGQAEIKIPNYRLWWSYFFEK